jgi:hypothetical protein
MGLVSICAVARRLMLLLVVLSFASACVSQSFYASQALRDTGQPLKVLLLNPDVTLYTQTAGGVLEAQDEWTAAAQRHIRVHLREIFEDRDIQLILADSYDEVAANDPQEIELLKLHSAVGESIMTHHYIVQNQLPTKKDEALWSLGPATTYLREKYQADYAVFVRVHDSYASAGRVAAIIVVAVLFGVGMQGGQQEGFASLVDLESGDIVWFNRLFRGTGDLREAEPARESVELLLTDFPAE